MDSTSVNLDWLLDPITKHYFDFEGVMDRKSFWMFVLYLFVAYVACYVVAGILSAIGLRPLGGLLFVLIGLAGLGVLLPSLGADVRRLHDTGKSGLWVLVSFIPLIGGLWLIYLLAQPSAAPYQGSTVNPAT